MILLKNSDHIGLTTLINVFQYLLFESWWLLNRANWLGKLIWASGVAYTRVVSIVTFKVLRVVCWFWHLVRLADERILVLPDAVFNTVLWVAENLESSDCVIYASPSALP